MLYRIALVIWIPLKRHLPLAHYVWSLFYPSAISSRWTLLKSTTHRSTTCIAEYPCPERLCSPEAKLVHVSLNIVGLHILFSEKKKLHHSQAKSILSTQTTWLHHRAQQASAFRSAAKPVERERSGARAMADPVKPACAAASAPKTASTSASPVFQLSNPHQATAPCKVSCWHESGTWKPCSRNRWPLKLERPPVALFRHWVGRVLLAVSPSLILVLVSRHGTR
jgi:hypothetical protein